MGQELLDFEDVLARNIDGYAGPHAETVGKAVLFFRLFINLLGDPRVPKRLKPIVNAGIAYFVTPYDLYPEKTLGVLGYIDDVVLCAYLAKILRKRGLAETTLADCWPGDNLWGTVDQVLSDTEHEIPGADREKLLRFAGLQ